MTGLLLPGPEMVRAARQVRVRGVVQGVGFRPFVHRLARRYRLGGWVRNRFGDVEIVVEGTEGALQAFLSDLKTSAPPLALIEKIEVSELQPSGFTAFCVMESAVRREDQAETLVTPDLAVCDSCIAELTDPGNRRFHYPFITCTDCGPRFSIIETPPYDRERTAMRLFAPCAECQREYADPGDRRYRSETNSCPACGPKLTFLLPGGQSLSGEPALAAAALLLESGGILALKGLGGYHLAVDATNEAAVLGLRKRKRREAKPFAVMVRTLEEAALVARLDREDQEILASWRRPILVAERVPGSPIAQAVAPGLRWIGLMLAYTPLHYLLLERVRRPLVMTSGNLTDEPIAAEDDEAMCRLQTVADAFLIHDRPIFNRCDDSVVRSSRSGPIIMRRARGYAPLPLTLPVATPEPLLAVGADLKNTIALARGRTAYVSQHIGDLENEIAANAFEEALSALKRQVGLEPTVVVHDLHPGYVSTYLARQMNAEEWIAVQHHHAHLAAVASEYGIAEEPVIGVTYDGTGYGLDGTIWGGEILVGDLRSYRRVARLRPAPLPGGDLAARSPWRCAVGYSSLDPALRDALAPALEGVPSDELKVAYQQIASGLNAPLASSMGRLFDAVAALLGVRRVSSYEGQAAMELESLARSGDATPIDVPLVTQSGEVWELDPVPLLLALAEARRRGSSAQSLAAAFHETIAAATACLVERIAETTGITTVALGGGVFQNARLVSSLTSLLTAAGFKVLLPRQLGPNDGALSYGQAAVAAAVLAAGTAGGG